jgi:hypothetical protein
MKVFKEENALLLINTGQISNVALLRSEPQKTYSLDSRWFSVRRFGKVVVQSAPPGGDCASDSVRSELHHMVHNLPG